MEKEHKLNVGLESQVFVYINQFNDTFFTTFAYYSISKIQKTNLLK